MNVFRSLSTTLSNSVKSILLLGPRQTGKSTLIQSLGPDLTLNLAQESLFLELSSDPTRFEEILRQTPARSIFIDEIQRIPALLNSVQYALDPPSSASLLEQRKFYLTGSSARKLKRGGANLIPGRIISHRLGALTARELGYSANTLRALSVGMLPEPYLGSLSAIDAEALLRTYAAVYVKEEVQAESLTRNISGFGRYLKAVAESSGTILDFTKLAHRAKVPRSSGIRFMEILEDTLLVHRIPSFQQWADLDTIKYDRYYFFDVGVWNGLIGNFGVSHDRSGVLFENLIAQQLMDSAAALGKPIDVSFLRTRGGLEIDFVVRFENSIFLIEAKVARPRSQDLESLTRISKKYRSEIRGSFVAHAETSPAGRTEAGIVIMPWQEVLKEIGL